jgi:[ribosomal protein S5]-alanine N-acetyltransferase
VLPEGFELRPLSLDDAPALAAAYDRNREHLGRWDPVRPPAFFTGGTLGYWVDAGQLRRGLAGAMVDFMVEQGIALGLHRLEAGTQVENVPSQRVLTRRGFEQYGLVPKFLYVAGAWRDHVLFQRILHDRPLEVGG